MTEHEKEYHKNYYQKNKDRILKLQKEYRIKNKDKFKEYQLHEKEKFLKNKAEFIRKLRECIYGNSNVVNSEN